MLHNVRRRRHGALAVVVALVAAVMVGAAAPTGALIGPPNPTLTPPPGQTAVSTSEGRNRLEIGGTTDASASLVEANIVIRNELGVIRTDDITEQVRLIGGTLSGSYILGLAPDESNAAELFLEVYTDSGSGPERGASAPVPIDLVRPTITTWRLVSTTTIEITFSEPVSGPNQPSDWAIGPSDDDVCPFDSEIPATVTGQGSRRTLTLVSALHEDATPHVCYRSRVEGYQDGAANPVVGDAEFADDAIPPRAPVITHIDGRALVDDEAASNDPTPDVTVGNVIQGHTVHVYLNVDGSPSYEPGNDPEVGSAVAGDDGAVVTVGQDLAGGRLPEGLNRFWVRAEDPSGNFSELADIDSAVYHLDTVAPVALAPAAATAARAFVSFSEPLFGSNDPSRWCVSTGAPVTAVRGTDGSTFREVEVAGLASGDTVSYDQCGGTPDPATRYTDAVGNALVPFTIEVGGGPVVFISDVIKVEGDDGPSSAFFELTISEPPVENARIDWATVPGTAAAGVDYAPASQSVWFLKGETDPKVVPVNVIGDRLDEFDEQFTVEITAANEFAQVLPGARAGTGTISDDDPLAALTVGDTTTTEGGSIDLPIRLDTASGKDVTVSWATRAGTAEAGADYRSGSGVAVIPAGSTQTTVSIVTLQDALDEDDETLTVELSQPTNATVADGVGTVTITDDDAPPSLRVSDAEIVELDTASSYGQVVVTLSAFSGRDVSFTTSDDPVTATRDVDYRVTTGRVTIPAGATSATLPVEVLPDELEEADERVDVVLSDPTGATLSDDRGQVTIIDNDGPTEQDRNGGDDRIDTAIEISRDTYPGTADNVVLARADAYPDALAGGPLAVKLDGPILLTGGSELHPAVAREIQRLDAKTVYLLGGEEALSPGVASDLASLGVATDRIGGATRFDTAAAIAERLDGPTAYVTEGINADTNRGWPDAVAVSALAAYQGAPILLTRADALPAATADALRARGITRATVVGGEVAVSVAVEQAVDEVVEDVDRLGGRTRYDTSRLINERLVAAGMEPRSAWFATGRNWPDSLTAGPAVVVQGEGVLLLIDGLEGFARSPEIGAFLDTIAERVLRIVIVGGHVAIAPDVARDIRDRLDG